MTEAEKNEIVALVMTQISSQAVDFDIATEQPQANDLLTAVRQTSSGEYMGVTLKWDDVARIATELANQAAKRAEQAETDANNILTQVQSKGTEITNFVATSKAEIETQKNEAVNTVQSVYQTDLNELKGDLADFVSNEDSTYDNIINWKKVRHGKLVWTTEEQDNDGYWNSGLLKVESSTSYVGFNPNENNNIAPITRITFYSGKDLNTYISATTSVNGTFTTPDNCKYIVISMRYYRNGAVTTYSETSGEDTYVGNMVVNVGDATNKTLPYPYHINPNVKVSNRRHEVGKTIFVNDANRGSASLRINRSVFTQGSTITIKVTGENIFDGVLQSGYWDGSTLRSSSTHKANVNPIYVSPSMCLYFSKDCRVTEYNASDEVIASYLATGRKPYYVNVNASYINVHGLNADMDAMYVNVSHLSSAATTYAEKKTTHVVRDWGSTNYYTDIELFDGFNYVVIESNASYETELIYDKNLLIEKISAPVNYSYMSKVNGTKFLAHRCSYEAPENTLSAIRKAFENGFNYVEMDLRFSSDNVAVLCHDATIDRTSNGTGNVADLTYEQLQTYDFGEWYGRRFRGIKIASFENAIKLCQALGLTPNIDAGNVSSTITEEQAQISYNILKKYGMEEKAVWVFANFNAVSMFYALYRADDKKIHYGWAGGNSSESTALSILDSLQWHKEHNADVVSDIDLNINKDYLTDTIYNSAKTKGIRLSVYFIDTLRELQSIMKYNVEQICTNKYDLAKGFCDYYYDVDESISS